MFKRQSFTESILAKFRSKPKSEPKSEITENQLDDQDIEFKKNISKQLDEFKKSKKIFIHLDPMNSFYRHITHQLAQDKGLFSISEGLRDDRHLVISRKPMTEGLKKELLTSDVKEPAKSKSSERPIRNKPIVKSPDKLIERSENSVKRPVSEKVTSVRAERSERSEKTNERPERIDRDRMNQSRKPERSRDRIVSNLFSEYLVASNEEGIDVILDKTGFVGIRTNQTDQDIVDSKKINSGSFRVVNNKIEEIK